MSNETCKLLMTGLLSASVTISMLSLYESVKLRASIDSVKSEISYCIWHNEKYVLRVIKGGQSERHALMDMGRPSDEGDCKK